jgi:MFS family permease
MRFGILSIIALLMSAALIQLSNGLQGILLPVSANMGEFSVFSIGILSTSFFIGLIIGCLFCPWMVRRVGHIRSFTALAAIASISALLHSVYFNEIAWWTARMLTGICFAGMQMVLESWLNERATNNTRGKILSIYTLLNLGFIVAGQQLLNLADPRSFMLFVFASMFLSLAVIPVALTTSPSPAPVRQVKLRIKWLYSISPAGVIGSLGVGLTNGAFWGLGALYAQQIGLTTPQITVFMSILVIGGALLQWPLGWISDRVDRRFIIIISCLASALSALFIASQLMSTVTWLFVLIGIFGAFALPIYALCLAHASDHTGASNTLGVSGGLLLIYSAGAMIGPVIASTLMELYGTKMLFFFTSFVHVMVAALIYWRVRISSPVINEEKDMFVAVLETLPVVNELDPRSPKH